MSPRPAPRSGRRFTAQLGPAPSHGRRRSSTCALDGGIHLRGDDLSPSLIRDVHSAPPRSRIPNSTTGNVAVSPHGTSRASSSPSTRRWMVTWSCHGACSTSSTRLAGEAGSKVDVEDKRSVGVAPRLQARRRAQHCPALRRSRCLPPRPGTARRSARVGQDRDGVLRHRGPEDLDPGARRPQDARRSVASADPGSARHQARAARRRKEASSPGSSMSPLFRRWPGATASPRRSAVMARSSSTSATTSRRPHSRRPPAQIPARWWLGLTATPYRRDRLDDLIAFQLGPVRHSFAPPEAGTLESSSHGRPHAGPPRPPDDLPTRE